MSTKKPKAPTKAQKAALAKDIQALFENHGIQKLKLVSASSKTATEAAADASDPPPNCTPPSQATLVKFVGPDNKEHKTWVCLP